jgi:hypothetical protein
MPVDLVLGEDELRMLKLLFSDGVADTRLMKDHAHYDAMMTLVPQVDQMTPNTPMQFSVLNVELIAKAVDLGRDKEDSLIFDKSISKDLETIDRVLATLVV